MIKSWQEWFKAENSKEYFQVLKQEIKKRYQTTVCFPVWERIFYAFQLTPKTKIKVVILGQDPYPNYYQADGLAFSVSESTVLPGSLKNILREVASNYACSQPLSGDLKSWAKQGVFLLNSILTVELKKPLAHKELGWEIFTDNVLKEINAHHQGVVFVFFGKVAQAKAQLITNKSHTVLAVTHPSPLSAHRGFFGSKIFLKINHFLNLAKKTSINWIK